MPHDDHACDTCGRLIPMEWRCRTCQFAVRGLGHIKYSARGFGGHWWDPLSPHTNDIMLDHVLTHDEYTVMDPIDPDGIEIYGGPQPPSIRETGNDHAVRLPARLAIISQPGRAAECTFTITPNDQSDQYTLALDGGGHITVEGTFRELRRLTIQLLLSVTEAQRLPAPNLDELASK